MSGGGGVLSETQILVSVIVDVCSQWTALQARVLLARRGLTDTVLEAIDQSAALDLLVFGGSDVCVAVLVSAPLWAARFPPGTRDAVLAALRIGFAFKTLVTGYQLAHATNLIAKEKV
eukprot:CAMPEP_0174903388 /NCGR_PEP_ID=MMETSP0167-20121228/43518_1 /TAXON_ID=38298 /ORGANISM="Rhodella maculata, Strain CCMP736" /LENGTH=117 /DNA_ID=CAMNT_0016145703 /DNA_START=131 /DNA_END=484 /DNA_ORIENTATION=+